MKNGMEMKTMNKFLDLLWFVKNNEVKLQSDYARYNAKLVAEAASRGYITSLYKGESHNRWYLTDKGFTLLIDSIYWNGK